jgi:AcrR family transcriptional regulator
MGRRVNRRGAATRQAVIDAAIELWSETGWRVTPVAPVAERAGITDAALLHHFGTKQNFLLAVLTELDRRNQAHWNAWIGMGGLDTLRRLPDLVRFMERRAGLYKLQLHLQADNLDPDRPAYAHYRGSHHYVHQVFADVVRTGQERGEIRADVDPELVGAQILAFISGMVLHQGHGPPHVDAVAVAEDFTDRLLRDLTPAQPGS